MEVPAAGYLAFWLPTLVVYESALATTKTIPESLTIYARPERLGAFKRRMGQVLMLCLCNSPDIPGKEGGVSRDFCHSHMLCRKRSFPRRESETLSIHCAFCSMQTHVVPLSLLFNVWQGWLGTVTGMAEIEDDGGVDSGRAARQ